MLRLDMEPLPASRFHADATVTSLPGLDMVWALNSPLCARRTRQLLPDGNDSFLFQWADSAGFCTHLGREIALTPRDAVVLSCCDTGSVTFPSAARLISLSIPRAVASSMLRDADGCLARPVPWGTDGLQLLVGYLEVLRHTSTTPTRELQRLAVAHVYDLLALTLGATKDAADVAKGRGVAAARLRAIQKDIREHLSDGELHISSLARRHRLTPRYVQMLFEAEGITFTEFVRARRLARAHRMLATPHFDHLRVSDVAFECGFGDVSYFNRAFRAFYNATPSDIRNRDVLHEAGQ